MRALCFAASLFVSLAGAPATWAQSADAGREDWSPVSWLSPVRVQDRAVWRSPLDQSAWRVGAFAGYYHHGAYRTIAFQPWRARGLDTSGRIFAANAVLTVFEAPRLPLALELDVTLAAHSGPRNFGEIAVAPALRWSWFPWSRYVHTTFRTAIVGLSYTTRESPLEAMDTEKGRTRRLLNHALIEWTFAPTQDSPWEAFVRLHHRSGVYGRMGGVKGGSNYVAIGVRSQL
ncbi:MAG: hypothetical protein IPL88_13455 [Rhizobiales bacterium]|nr:hypothetical protein [Hyphomicrobiales bacterium]